MIMIRGGIMPEKTTFRHLSHQDRLNIEKGITYKESFTAIAKQIGVSVSTISREVLRNRVRDRSTRYGKGVRRFCANEKDCSVRGLCEGECERLCRVCTKSLCTIRCPYHEEACCEKLTGPPYCCNRCTKKASCFVERFIYDATQASRLATERKIAARVGIDLDWDEARDIEKWLVPLIKNGQTPEQVFENHADKIPFSQRTLYTYIAQGVFVGLTNFDLQRKVRYKKRHRNSDVKPRDLSGHTYTDFKELDAEVRNATVEGDTVIGRVGGKCLLTFLMRSCSLMAILLLERCDQQSVTEAFAFLSFSLKGFSDGFLGSVFETLLVDRGSEFLHYEDIEAFLYVDDEDEDDTDESTRVYYCDPRCPQQRGALEKNHTYIREILPKGSSFDELTEADVRLMASHLNSIPRSSLGGKTPYEVAGFLYGDGLTQRLGISRIKPDEVIRRPWLLDEPPPWAFDHLTAGGKI
jgi:IS30 family transposase